MYLRFVTVDTHLSNASRSLSRRDEQRNPRIRFGERALSRVFHPSSVPQSGESLLFPSGSKRDNRAFLSIDRRVGQSRSRHQSKKKGGGGEKETRGRDTRGAGANYPPVHVMISMGS